MAYRDLEEKRQKEFKIPVFSGTTFHNLREFGEHLQKQEEPMEIKCNDEVHKLKTVTLPAADGEASVLWYDEAFVDKIMDGSVVFIDGTFNARPKIPMDKKKSQFLTFMGEVNGKVSNTLL